MSEEQKNTVELEVVDPANSEVEEKFTEDQLQEAGVSAAEIELAKKNNMIAEPEKKKEGEEKAGEQKPEDDPEAEKPKSEFENVGDREKTELMFEKMLRDPEYEKKMLEGLKPGDRVHGTYFKMKAERQKRQTLEIQSEQERLKIKSQEKEIEKLRKQVEELGSKEELDEFGNPKPKKEIIEEESEEAKQEKVKAENAQRNEIVKAKLAEFEVDAKSRYEDYDKAVELTADILQNIDKIFESTREKARISHKLTELLWATRNADKFKDGEYGPADMAYEIGRLHPDYKAPNADGDKNGKQDSGLPAEKAARAIENSKKRTSASISSGTSKRVVTYEDLTLEDAARMPPDQYRKLPKEVRERLLRL